MVNKIDLIKKLKYYNDWRRGAEIEMPSPQSIGELMDNAINYIKQSNNQWINVKDKLPKKHEDVLVAYIDKKFNFYIIETCYIANNGKWYYYSGDEYENEVIFWMSKPPKPDIT